MPSGYKRAIKYGQVDPLRRLCAHRKCLTDGPLTRPCACSIDDDVSEALAEKVRSRPEVGGAQHDDPA